MSAIARVYVDAIRAYQPAGPYFIGGWCVWGVVAFEVAQQLIEAGEEVGLLVLLHAVSPVQYRRTSSLAQLVSKVRYHLAQMQQQPGGKRWRYALNRGQAAARDAARLPHDANASASPRFADILADAAVNYTPTAYPGAVALFQPMSRPEIMDFRAGWSEVVQGAFTAYDTRATHWTMLDEGNVGALGQAMSAALAAAQRGRRRGAELPTPVATAPAGRALPPSIVPFRRDGRRPTLFWLSPGPVFRPLADAIGPDQPFLGVALDPAEMHALPASARFEDIARLLVRDIRAVQPSGPYYVGGWCTGGILAFEVAVQLAATGERVGQVLLLDAVNPVQYRGFGRVAVSVSKLKFHLDRALVQRGGGWRYAAARGRGALRRAVQNLNPACLPPEFEDLLERAALDYAPVPYDGDVTLFQPAERPDVFDYRPGWREVVRGTFTACDVPGTHRTVLDAPQVGELGAAMRACLAHAQATDRAAMRAAE